MKTSDIYLERLMIEAEKAIVNGSLQEGKDLLEEVLSYEPDSAKGHNLMGWMYQYYIHDDGMAEVHFKWALKFDPTFPPPYIHLSTLYLRNEQYNLLEDIIRRAKSIKGLGESEIARKMGFLEEARGHYSRAIRHYGRAILKAWDNGEIEELKGHIKRCKLKRMKVYSLSISSIMYGKK